MLGCLSGYIDVAYFQPQVELLFIIWSPKLFFHLNAWFQTDFMCFMRRLSVFPTFWTYIKLGLPNCLLCILATCIASDHLICFLSFLLIYLWEEQMLTWLLAPSFFLINDGNHFNLNNNFLLFFLFLLWLKKKKKKIKIRTALFSSFVILLCSFCTL
jgi:hypothetical protein